MAQSCPLREGAEKEPPTLDIQIETPAGESRAMSIVPPPVIVRAVCLSLVPIAMLMGTKVDIDK
jgi:hypothetical protein